MFCESGTICFAVYSSISPDPKYIIPMLLLLCVYQFSIVISYSILTQAKVNSIPQISKQRGGINTGKQKSDNTLINKALVRQKTGYSRVYL